MEHLNEENIKYSETFLKHRELLKRLFLFLFFFLDILIILNLAYRFVSYNNGLVTQLQVENSLATSYIPFEQLRRRLAPKDLIIQKSTLIKTQAGKYDLVVQLNNPNDKWLAKKVTLAATVDGSVVEPLTVQVLPVQEQYAIWFGLPSQLENPAVRVEILDIEWLRIRETEPIEILKQIKFSQPRFRNLDSGFTVEAEITNGSAYGFWNFGVLVLAERSGEVVGANLAYVERFTAGSSRSFSVAWPVPIASPQSVRIIPLLDVFDQENYMPVSSFGQPGDPSGLE